MSDKFVMSARQSAELDFALERNECDPAFVKWLSSDDNLAQVRRVKLGEARIVPVELVLPQARVNVGAWTRFVATDAFGLNNPDSIRFFLGDNFRNNFLDKVEENVPAGEINIHQLQRKAFDLAIMAKLGIDQQNKKGVIKLAHFYELIRAQATGQRGHLLVDEYANIAYVEDVKRLLWAVYASWRSAEREWFLQAYPDPVSYPVPWNAGNQVLSKLSLFKNPVYRVFVCFCQPPSIFPTSFKGSDKVMYFLLSKTFISQAIRRKNFNRSSSSDALLKYASFW